MFYKRNTVHFKVVPLINEMGIHYTIRVYQLKQPDMVSEFFMGVKSKNKYFGYVDEDGDICEVDDIFYNLGKSLKFSTPFEAINYIREEFGNQAKITTWQPDL